MHMRGRMENLAWQTDSDLYHRILEKRPNADEDFFGIVFGIIADNVKPKIDKRMPNTVRDSTEVKSNAKVNSIIGNFEMRYEYYKEALEETDEIDGKIVITGKAEFKVSSLIIPICKSLVYLGNRGQNILESKAANTVLFTLLKSMKDQNGEFYSLRDAQDTCADLFNKEKDKTIKDLANKVIELIEEELKNI